MNIIFFGTPDFVIPVLESLQKNFNVIAVVTTPDQPTGRKQTLTPSPIKTYAQTHHIPVLTPTKLTSETFSIGHLRVPRSLGEVGALDINSVDLFVVAAYGKIIPQPILDLPKFGSLNIHPSLLPKYRGTAPLQNTILNGDQTTGVTIIKMDEKMDHGPILMTKTAPVHTHDTFATLAQRMFKLSADILPTCITEYTQNKIIPQEQNHNQATYTKIITKQDGYIDLTTIKNSNELEIGNWKLEIARKIRAFYPWPTAWTRLQMKNGEEKIIKFLPEEKIQMEGKKPVSLKEFYNGYPEIKENIEKLFPNS